MSMPSSRSRLVPPTLLNALSCALLTLVCTGAASAPPKASRATDQRVEQNDGQTEHTAAAPPTYTLRCWQYGRLILEETSLETAGEVQPAAPLRQAGSGTPVYLFDTRNATCLLKE
jgi:hypothetical protein